MNFLLITALLAGLLATFAFAYLVARRIDNYSIVDVVWSYAFAGVALVAATALDGWAPRRWLLAALVGLWSLRLGTHLLRRIAAHHPQEEGRYVTLRERWKARFASTMFGFYLLQAVFVLLLAWPCVLIAARAETAFGAWEALGAALVLGAWVGEGIADRQLKAFRQHPANRGAVCDRGLWRYSRHPNYFFEWLIWVGFFLIALPAPHGWLAALSPLLMLWLLLKVSGVPPTEEQSLRTRGDAYRAYQRRTNRFFPGPVRPESRAES